ncbi:hypothetical protein L249_7168 [Ophiocordyceps polyrhachis-furcata BCC 54312]|uniref:Uncharacterized protein n=1 Tax=Ophiocordyceps polyrhachis-furcata BCC 54312 TaxID=1330021 RepID=A0A367LAY3_9HYPO|nr:hypothetical protein L249_7168 [Ophiocordyceps polyrhachis-furcata BCC 54312]
MLAALFYGSSGSEVSGFSLPVRDTWIGGLWLAAAQVLVQPVKDRFSNCAEPLSEERAESCAQCEAFPAAPTNGWLDESAALSLGFGASRIG